MNKPEYGSSSVLLFEKALGREALAHFTQPGQAPKHQPRHHRRLRPEHNPANDAVRAVIP